MSEPQKRGNVTATSDRSQFKSSERAAPRLTQHEKYEVTILSQPCVLILQQKVEVCMFLGDVEMLVFVVLGTFASVTVTPSIETCC